MINYHDRVLKVVKETHLEDILDFITNDKKEIYFIGGVSRAIILDEYYSNDIDIVIPDFDDKLVEDLSKKFIELKSLAIKYKDQKDKEIKLLNIEIDNFKKSIQDSNNSYENMLDRTTKSLEQIIKNSESISKIQ